VTLDGNPQCGLLRLVTVLQRTANLRQHLVRQLQQNLALRRKAQRLAFTYEEAKAKALFEIAELVGEGGLRLMQRGCCCRQRSAVP